MTYRPTVGSTADVGWAFDGTALKRQTIKRRTGTVKDRAA